MNLKEARALRDEIKEAGLHCIVPLGYGPSYYFAQIYSSVDGELLKRGFYSQRAWRSFKKKRDKERREFLAAIDRRVSRPRSPIDAMIDQACGITAKDYR